MYESISRIFQKEKGKTQIRVSKFIKGLRTNFFVWNYCVCMALITFVTFYQKQEGFQVREHSIPAARYGYGSIRLHKREGIIGEEHHMLKH